jgi:hypothetical protein
LLRSSIVIAGLVCCALGVRAVQAVIVRDLGVAAVPVAQRTGDPPYEALRAAMSAVVVKLSGRRDTAADPRVAELLGNPGGFVQQTGYTEEGQLRVGFDANALRTWMLARGLPVWGDDRPSVMLWLAIDLAGGNRSIVGADDDSGVQQALVTVAGERGLPLQLPLLDAQDLARVQFGDIWGGFDGSLRDATARYGADAILIGRATGPTLDQVFVKWRLVQGDDVEDWQGTLIDGVEHTADVLAARYASTSAGAEQQLHVSVSGLASGQAYARVLHYLQALSLVSSVRVERVAGNKAEFTLVTLGEPEKLSRQLELSGFLASEGTGGLAYTYRP